MLINETNNSMEIRSINIMNYKGISVLFEKIKFKNNSMLLNIFVDRWKIAIPTFMHIFCRK